VGSSAIHGELLKLGSRSPITVAKYMTRRQGHPPGLEDIPA